MASEEERVEVELNIFSGRPNPRWGLSADKVDELARKVSSLTGSAVESKASPQLGYRGIAVINSGKAVGLPELIYAYSGVLTIVDGETTSYLEDVNRVEQWLLNQARERGFGEAIHDALRQEGGGGTR